MMICIKSWNILRLVNLTDIFTVMFLLSKFCYLTHDMGLPLLLIKCIIILGCHHLSCLPGRIVTSCGAKKEGVNSVNKKVWRISRPENQETNKMMIRLGGKFSGGLAYACSWKSLIIYFPLGRISNRMFCLLWSHCIDWLSCFLVSGGWETQVLLALPTNENENLTPGLQLCCENVLDQDASAHVIFFTIPQSCKSIVITRPMLYTWNYVVGSVNILFQQYIILKAVPRSLSPDLWTQ